jgi:hypothetical protein
MHYLNKTTKTTAMISVTLLIGAAAVLVLSLAENVQAQTTIEEALRLLNAGADDLESVDPSAAERLRDVAAQLGEGSTCSDCFPLP